MTDHSESSFRSEAPPSGWRTRRFALLDFLAVAVLLAVANALLARNDPGWFLLNPTPWLVVPAVLGVRYGFMAGLVSGTVTAALIFGARHFMVPGESLADHKFLYASLPFLGVIVGQFAETLRRRRLDLERDNAQLRERNERLNCECQLLFLARQDLQQRLGLFGADSASLDEDLQKLAGTSREFAPVQLLDILGRIARVRSAALYELPAKRKSGSISLNRTAFTGGEEFFPDKIRTRDHQIVREAVEGRTFLVQKSLLEPVPSREPGYLLAYPIETDSASSYVLIIQDLPFDDINMVNFEVIKSTCDWLRFFLMEPVEGTRRHRAVSEGEFVSAVESAVSTHTEQAVPSTLVRLPFDDPGTPEAAASFNELLEALPQSGILTNCFRNGQRFLLFLLPAVSDSTLGDSIRSAFTRFSEGWSASGDVEPHILCTELGESTAQTWNRLMGTT